MPMARPRKAVRAARDRWSRARRFKAMEDRIDSVIGRTLCERHFGLLQQGIYVDGLHEVCTMVSEAEESVDREVEAFFPLAPELISQEKLKEFKRWLKSDIGKLIRQKVSSGIDLSDMHSWSAHHAEEMFHS